ncbi:MAG: NUDIX domain-containing protein [Chloroflexota bacterium]
MPSKTTIHTGERIGRQGRIRLGCSAVIFDESRQKVLLTRRADNGLWCLPGGAVDPGESVEEACTREVFEETGLRSRVTRLVGVYSDPHKLIEYPDGAKAQIVALSFEVEITGGGMSLSNETSGVDFFALEAIAGMDLLLNHEQRILDALEGKAEAFIR